MMTNICITHRNTAFQRAIWLIRSIINTGSSFWHRGRVLTDCAGSSDAAQMDHPFWGHIQRSGNVQLQQHMDGPLDGLARRETPDDVAPLAREKAPGLGRTLEVEEVLVGRRCHKGGADQTMPRSAVRTLHLQSLRGAPSWG